MHALALFSEALRREVLGTPAQRLADRVVEATQSVSGLLNGFLDISKIDAGAVRPVFAPVGVDEIFLRLTQMYEDRAVAAGLQLRFHPIPSEIVSDADLLLRVLFNFVDNAFKYCDRGGVLVSVRQRRARIRLAVWDTGRGIGAEHLPRVFASGGWLVCWRARLACVRRRGGAACSGSIYRCIPAQPRSRG